MARRGEIWLVDFGDPVGRPAVVISDDRLNRSRAELAIVVPVTTTARGLPSHIEIEPDESGLKGTSYAKAEEVKSVSTKRLVRRLGVVPADRLNRAERALRLLLGL